MTTHTEGPWNATERDRTVGGFTIRVGDDDDLLCLAIVPLNGRFAHEVEANAKLIAAAPDMLAALKEAEELLADLADDDGSVRPVRQQVLAAIVKAEATPLTQGE